MSARTHSCLTSPSLTASSRSVNTPQPRSTPPTINYKFWFDDIHVVLVTIDRIAYRVRRDCLESASRRLRHLIAKASQTADKESPFGCPTVHLDLPSSSLEPFLEVVTDPMGDEKLTWLAYRRNPPDVKGCLSFLWLAALARTAHELGAYHTQYAALTRIRHFFESDTPLTFVSHSKSFQENWAWWGTECGITITVEHAIEALNLSRLLPVPLRFPLALYACCLLPPAQLRSGVTRADGVVEQLSEDDFGRCMRALPWLHIANRDSVAKTFAHADEWECLGAPRSAFPCEGKHGMRRIRDAYMAHMRRTGPGAYRPELRDLLCSLTFKSLPYERCFAPEGSSLVCGECVARLVDSSETLCSEEAANLEQYFFPEDENDDKDEDKDKESVEGNVSNHNSAPRELGALTPSAVSESESESEAPSGSPTDAEATAEPDPLASLISSGRSPSTPSPESETSSQCLASPASAPSSFGADKPCSQMPESSTTPSSRSPRLELAMLAPLAIGWDDRPELDDDLLWAPVGG